jgi:hypothetical protein
MANKYGQERVFKVFRIVSNGHVGAFETFYGLVSVRSFDNLEEAESWVNNEGERHVDYTIIEVIRNK